MGKQPLGALYNVTIGQSTLLIGKLSFLSGGFDWVRLMRNLGNYSWIDRGGSLLLSLIREANPQQDLLMRYPTTLDLT